MFGQPRCREWTPLATQQLRLRSLIQIVGYNIYEDETYTQSGSLYYTLHATTMSAPFYTSEKLLSNHPKWREIDSELILKMSSQNVVVRIWRHTLPDRRKPNQTSDGIHHSKTDTIVQTWGVNFTGLLHIGANLALDFTPKSFKENTLVFQMIGGYFCSYDSVRLESVTGGFTNCEADIVAVMRKEVSPSRKIPIDARHVRGFQESKSVSPSRLSWRNENVDNKFISKSQSPPTNSGFKQSFASAKSVSNYSVNRQEFMRGSREFYRYDDAHSNTVYEHSPKSDASVEIREYSGSDEGSDVLMPCGSVKDVDRIGVEESEAADNIDAKLIIPKCRYSSLKFLKSEIRPSYNAEKLQKLHLLQYTIKKRTQAVQEIKEKIYHKSAMDNYNDLSPQSSLIDNGDFSRSESLSVSCREFSLITGKNRHSSRCKNLGTILSASKCNLVEDLEVGGERNSQTNWESDEARAGRGKSLPPDKQNVGAHGQRRFSGYKEEDSSKPTDRRFTLALNKLLEFKSQPSPSQRLRHAQLTRAIEVSRFKRRLLQDERDSALAALRRAREFRTKLFEENQDSGTDLMQKLHSLKRKSDQLYELKKSEAALRELCARSSSQLHARRWKIVQDIQLIYPIHEDEAGRLCILGVHLPACRDPLDGLRQCTETALAVALGRVAHCTAMAASLLAAPLRHPLKLMGSRTKVLDHLAPQEGEIPLFARNKDSMMFRYGLFLLNKNIAQLLWATHRIITPDPRDTLTNLRRLLTLPTPSPGLEASRVFGSASSMETAGFALFHPLAMATTPSQQVAGLHRAHGSMPSANSCSVHPLRSISSAPLPPSSLRSLVADRSARGLTGGSCSGHRQFNRFKDSVDGHSPRAAMVIRKHRYSRSVGSYVDEQMLQSLEMSPSSAMGSEPSLIIQSDNQRSGNENPSQSPSENIQNVLSFSESDLTKVTDIISPETCSSVNDLSLRSEGKVIFSLGDPQSPEQGETIEVKSETSAKVSIDDADSNSEDVCDPSDGSNNKSLSKEMIEARDAQNDVNELIIEIAGLTANLSTNITFGVSDQSIQSGLDKVCRVPRGGELNDFGQFESFDPYHVKRLDFSNSTDVTDNSGIDKSFDAIRANSSIDPDASNAKETFNSEFLQKLSFDENESNITQETSSTRNASECYALETDNLPVDCKLLSGQVCTVDIEKLGYPPYCSKPCSKICPRITGEFPLGGLHTGYDQCENGDEVMQDVIVLPSAEAVMTASSHFTDSPGLLDLEGVEQAMELTQDVLDQLSQNRFHFKDCEKESTVSKCCKCTCDENVLPAASDEDSMIPFTQSGEDHSCCDDRQTSDRIRPDKLDSKSFKIGASVSSFGNGNGSSDKLSHRGNVIAEEDCGNSVGFSSLSDDFISACSTLSRNSADSKNIDQTAKDLSIEDFSCSEQSLVNVPAIAISGSISDSLFGDVTCEVNLQISNEDIQKEIINHVIKNDS